MITHDEDGIASRLPQAIGLVHRNARAMHGHCITLICQYSTSRMKMHWANKFVLLSSVPGALAVCREQLPLSIFAECCCVFGLTEGTAYSLTDSKLSSVYYQGFTLRSNYCSSWCRQEWRQIDLYVYLICWCLVGASFFWSYQISFSISLKPKDYPFSQYKGLYFVYSEFNTYKISGIKVTQTAFKPRVLCHF